MLTRRNLLIAGLAGSIYPLEALAGTWPTQNIKFIVPYGAGGGFDLYVRAVAPVMEKHLPHPVQILPDNIRGGGGVLGVGQLYRAHPDGYTIGVLNIPGMFVLQRTGGASFDLRRFSYIGGLGRDNYAIAVGANSPIKSIADLQKLSAKRPVKFTSTGREGTAFSATLIAAHLLGIKPKMILGYKGSNDYVVAAMRGDGDAVVSTVPFLRKMQEGKLMRILATFETRSSVPGAEDATSLKAPDLTKIGLERLVAAPPHLPSEIQAGLSKALSDALADPAVKSWAKKTGTELLPRTPSEAAHIVAEQADFYSKWKSIIDAS